MPDVRSGLDPVDYRYINPNPDPDFSPERNKAVVEETMRETTKFFQSFGHREDKDLENRIDILTNYADYRLNRGKTKDIKQYLGRKLYESLIGEQVLEKVRIAEATNRLNGNTRLKKGILI